MAYGWECRSKLLKQIPTKPTERRHGKYEAVPTPGPNYYEMPQLYCGNGYSKIKRAPAYTFGFLTPPPYPKPASKPNAPVFNIQGMCRKGRNKITHSVLTPHIEPPGDKTKIPGPGAHAPQYQIRIKRPPAYSLRAAARPPYQPWDQWTPSPNMYLPPIPGKREPAYSLGYPTRILRPQELPGPGEHDPKFEFVQKTKPAFSLGAPFRSTKPARSPAPNQYCEKKFMYQKPFPHTPSFGIHHTPYLGNRDQYLKSSKLDLITGEE